MQSVRLIRWLRLLVLVSAISLVWTTAASAMTCKAWSRLGGSLKASAIHDMIEDAMASQGGRNYGVNRGAIERCLYSKALTIEYDFDDTCADPRKASMQALNTLFKNYIWTCVN